MKDPIDCEKCIAIFCAKCLKKNPQNQCAYCGTKDIKKRLDLKFNQKLLNLLQGLLNELQFSCSICQEIFKYEEHQDHIEHCGSSSLPLIPIEYSEMLQFTSHQEPQNLKS